MSRLLFWTPRVLCVAFAGFLSIFALDVFSEHAGFAHTAVAFLLHLIPAAVVLLALAVAWRREWIGAILFPLLAVVHVASAWGRFEWTAYAVIDGPLLVLGLLFALNWRHRRCRD